MTTGEMYEFDLLQFIGAVFCGAVGIFAVWIYPRCAASLNDLLPRSSLLRKMAFFPLKNHDYGSPENLAQVRRVGYGGPLLSAYCIGSRIFQFIRSAVTPP